MPRKKSIDHNDEARLATAVTAAEQSPFELPAAAPMAAIDPTTSLDSAKLVVEEPAARGKAPFAINSAVSNRLASFRQSGDSLGALSKQLGATVWSYEKRFDWARDPTTRHHFTFTRWYFHQRVLVDVWPNATNDVRAESAKREKCIAAENVRRAARGEKPIGYLSIVRGIMLSNEAFERVLRGEVLPLLERRLEGVPA